MKRFLQSYQINDAADASDMKINDLKQTPFSAIVGKKAKEACSRKNITKSEHFSVDFLYTCITTLYCFDIPGYIIVLNFRCTTSSHDVFRSTACSYSHTIGSMTLSITKAISIDSAASPQTNFSPNWC